MKRFYFILIAFLLCSAVAQAKFCMNCGENLPDLAQFCSKCGYKQTIVDTNNKDKKTSTQTLTKIGKSSPNKTKRLLLKINAFYIAKTDIFLYKKRGAEKNALKKNLFFKPRRYRMKKRCTFKVIEVIGNSCLVESRPDKKGKTIQGWVNNEQLTLRSDWKK